MKVWVANERIRLFGKDFKEGEPIPFDKLPAHLKLSLPRKEKIKEVEVVEEKPKKGK